VAQPIGVDKVNPSFGQGRLPLPPSIFQRSEEAMQRTVKVFVIPQGRSPGGPPEPAQQLVVEATSIDGLREQARTQLVAEGYRVRSLSCGPKGLIAYVEAGQ
jgi:hypothetical protein